MPTAAPAGHAEAASWSPGFPHQWQEPTNSCFLPPAAAPHIINRLEKRDKPGCAPSMHWGHRKHRFHLLGKVMDHRQDQDQNRGKMSKRVIICITKPDFTQYEDQAWCILDVMCRGREKVRMLAAGLTQAAPTPVLTAGGCSVQEVPGCSKNYQCGQYVENAIVLLL